MVFRATQMEIICQIFISVKMTYQLTPSMLEKILEFYIIGSLFFYTIAKGDHMQKSQPWEVDVPTYHFGLHQTIGVSSYMVMFRVHSRQGHAIGPFHYNYPRKYLSNSLSSHPNEYFMQKLCPQDVYLGTYYFGVHKKFRVSSPRFIFNINYSQKHKVDHFHYFSP